ncbi:DEAD/DEAH box helicase [Propionivibrio sp.]|uniref:DEAD/DEAH box helicase n=1 Tax=Propionivibrio sp. TaxID=2212460 RepID=UPI0039E25568
MKFTELGLVPEILRAIADQGYETPTPIQAQAIPKVVAGHDLMACAQTGTGKTAGFTLPILNRLASSKTTGPRKIRVLILTPTRELAAQVEDSVRTYGAHLPFRSLVVFGGVGINPQIAALKKGVNILVATPGRLLDHAQQRTVNLSGIDVLVLDEADRMLDMGFIHDIRRVLALLPKKRQNLLFSATFSDEIRTLAGSFLVDPEYVESERRNTAPELVKQYVYRVDRERKRDLLVDLIQEKGWSQVLVFTRTKWGANGLAEKLLKAGIGADAIHGNKSQNARTRALADFKSGKLHVLVATDIAARGIDIDELPHVVELRVAERA